MYKSSLFALGLGLAALQVGLISCGGDQPPKATTVEMNSLEVLHACESAMEIVVGKILREQFPNYPLNPPFFDRNAGLKVQYSQPFDAFCDSAKANRKNIVHNDRYLEFEMYFADDQMLDHLHAWFINYPDDPPARLFVEWHVKTKLPPTVFAAVFEQTANGWENISARCFPSEFIKLESGYFAASYTSRSEEPGKRFGYRGADGRRWVWAWNGRAFATE